MLTFVTGNAKKLAEVRQILAAQAEAAGSSGGGLPYEVASQKIDLPELQGEPAEIAAEKCRLAALEVRGGFANAVRPSVRQPGPPVLILSLSHSLCSRSSL